MERLGGPESEHGHAMNAAHFFLVTPRVLPVLPVDFVF